MCVVFCKSYYVKYPDFIFNSIIEQYINCNELINAFIIYARIHINAMTTTTPTPTPNPYAPIVAKPNIPQGAPGAPIPAPVTKTPDFASQNAAAAADHNRLVLANSGLKVGGSKRRGSKSKQKRGSKSKQRRGSKSKQKRGSKSKQRRGSKRSGSKSKRSKRKRGGASFIPTTTTTTTPTPTPTVKAVTVPQFSGSPSASAASLNNNHLAMKGAAQAALDNPNAPPTYTKLV